MKKIISLFQRNYDGDRLVRDEVVPGAEWVVAGDGVATEKVDGTSCLVRDGKIYKRYDAKHGKMPPVGFEPAQEPDPVTGHWPGWLPVSETEPSDKWHREAFGYVHSIIDDGTFELVGPKVQGNPYKLSRHSLVRHGNPLVLPDHSVADLKNVPRTYDALKAWFADHVIEGVVWHHPDGRMVKIKRKDFGYKWPEKD